MPIGTDGACQKCQCDEYKVTMGENIKLFSTKPQAYLLQLDNIPI